MRSERPWRCARPVTSATGSRPASGRTKTQDENLAVYKLCIAIVGDLPPAEIGEDQALTLSGVRLVPKFEDVEITTEGDKALWR